MLPSGNTRAIIKNLININILVTDIIELLYITKYNNIFLMINRLETP